MPSMPAARERALHPLHRVVLVLMVRSQQGSPKRREPQPKGQAPPAAPVDPARHVTARGSKGLRVGGAQESQHRLPRRKLTDRRQ